MSRRRRGRRQNFDDSNDIIYPNEGEEYIDFQNYPLTIDWTEIENDESAAYEICDKFGYFGVSLFTTLSTIDDFDIMKEEKFVKNIVDYFYTNFIEEGVENLNRVKIFVEKLPKLSKIREIISGNMVYRKVNFLSSKELFLIKLVLDFYEAYLRTFDCPLFNNLINELIPTALLFYSVLSDEEVELIYETFQTCRDIFKMMSKNIYDLENQLNCYFSKKKSMIINHLTILRNENLFLSGGNYNSLFLK